MIVNDLLVEHFPDVVDVGFTAQIEEHLDQVAEGATDWVPVVKEFYDPFASTVEQAAALVERVEIADEPSDEVCDVCGRPMVIKLGRFGRFLACSGFPDCRNTRTLLTKIGVDCPKCGAPLIARKTRRGRTFYGCSTFPNCDFASWQRPVPERCPVEGGLQIAQGAGKIVCTVCGRTTEPGPQGRGPAEPDDSEEPDGGAERSAGRNGGAAVQEPGQRDAAPAARRREPVPVTA